MQDRFVISSRLTPILPLLLAIASALTAQQPDCSQWTSVVYWKGTITIQGNSPKLTVPGVPNLSGTFQESDTIQLTLTNAEISGAASAGGPGTQAGPIYFVTGGQDLQVSFNRTETNGDCTFQVTDGHPVYPTSVYGFIDLTKGNYSLFLGICCTPLTIQPIVTGPLNCQADAPPSALFGAPPSTDLPFPIPTTSLPGSAAPITLNNSYSFTDSWNIKWVFSWDLTPSRPWVKVWMAGRNTGQPSISKDGR
jgi:hypothetical protein